MRIRACVGRRTPTRNGIELDAKGNLREVTIEAVVIRKDGTREDLGVVSSWHKNPLIRLARKLKEKKHGNVRS